MAGYDDDMGHDEDLDVDVGVDQGQDDTVGEDDQGNGDQGNGDQANGGDADVQASESSGVDTGDGSNNEVEMVEYDFTPNKAVDKDEDSLIAYDRYKGDPVYKSGDPSRSATVGARQAYADQDNVVDAYVMAVASQSGPAQAERARNIGAPGTGYKESVQSYNRQMKEGWDSYDKRQDQIVDYESPSLVDEAGMTEEISTWGTAKDSLLRGQTQDSTRRTSDFSHALRSRDLDQLTRENAEAKSLADARMREVAFAEKRAANATRMMEINETLGTAKNTEAIINSINISDKDKAIMLTENAKREVAQKHMRMVAGSVTGLEKLKTDIKNVSTFKEGFWTGFRKQDNKTKREVQNLIENYREKYRNTLKQEANLNTRMINSEGFVMDPTLSKIPGGMIFGAIQGLMNSLGIAYHKTDTEKELEEIMMEWGLIEKEHNEKTVEERKVLCGRKDGWEWDEDAQVCKMKSADRFSKENRFVPQY